MPLLINRAVQTTNSTGTNDFTLNSVEDGYVAIRDEAPDGAKIRYVCTDNPVDPTVFEIGTGTLTYGGSDVLSRDDVLLSSNSNSKISLSGGTTYSITGTVVAEDIQPGSEAKTSAYTLTMTDIGKHFSCDASSAGFTVTLPAAATATGRYWAIVANTGASNAVTIDPNAAETINGAATLVLTPGQAALVRCDGSRWSAVTPNLDTMSLPEQASAPSTAANEVAFYAKEVDSEAVAMVREESDGDEIQLTRGGQVSGTLVQGTAQASTSGTAVDFVSIPSWVKRITLSLDQTSTNGTSALVVELGDSGGFEQTGYNESAVVSVSGTTTDLTTIGASFPLADVGNASASVSGVAILTLVSGTTWAYTANTCSASARTTFSAGSKTLSSTLTQIRVKTFNGTDTFDNGTINIQFE